MGLQPCGDRRGLVGGVVVADQVHVQLGGDPLVERGQELLEFGGAMPAVDGSVDLAGGHVQRGEQGGDAVAQVVMACAARACPGIIGSTGADRSRAWIWRFLIDAEHQRLFRRIQIEPDDVADLVDEVRVGADLEGVDQVRFEPERLPDPAHRRLRQPVLLAIDARDQWVASPGWRSSVATTTCSICSSPIVRGAPGRGSSASPSNRRRPQTVAATCTPSAATHPTRRRLPCWICLPHSPTRSDDRCASACADFGSPRPPLAACHAPRRSTPPPSPACPRCSSRSRDV